MKRSILIAFAVAGLGLGAAFAEPYHPRSEDSARVQDLARSLADATERLYDAALAQRHHGDDREQRALRRLADLEASARYFRRQIGAPGADLSESREEFDQVVATYTRVSSGLDDLH